MIFDLTLHERRELECGLGLLEQGRSFEAHECFEDVFRHSSGAVRVLFRGLAQLAASYYQLSLGRARGARSTLEKACRQLAGVGCLSAGFRERVTALFDTVSALEGGARFLDDPSIVESLHKWPVPDFLLPGPSAPSLRLGGETDSMQDSGQGASATKPSGQVGFHGFNTLLGLTLLESSADKVVAELLIDERHHQPWGIVHGGVYCAIVETLCSLGAQQAIAHTGGFIVGVDNHTSFLKATRSGKLLATARPLSPGKRTQLWEANIENEQHQLVATGRVRLMVVPQGGMLAGEAVSAK